MTRQKQPNFVIGVDVGGTNTDGVLVDLSGEGSSAVISTQKAPTTPDVTSGIETTLATLLSSPIRASGEGSAEADIIDRESIVALTIGTTHFLNAVVQRNAAHLSRVAIIRLGSHGFVDTPAPFAGWPRSLRDIVEGYTAIVPGGVNIDGKLVAPLDKHSFREQARRIFEAGLHHVVIVGMGSPMDQTYHQEAEAKELLHAEMSKLDPSYAKGVDFVLSHTVAGPGLLTRENASILNASILTFARRTIHSFILAMRNAGLKCPLYLTSNAGHLLSCNDATDYPVKLFSSGPTNSMRGAAFLAQDVIRGGQGRGSVIVVDIGGTTTDVGALLPNGYPRLNEAYTNLAGVQVNLSMPAVESIGLGGGSIVHISDTSNPRVGPDSVGHDLPTQAICYGGTTVTATDIAVSQYSTLGSTTILGAPDRVSLSQDCVASAESRIKQMLESLVDRIKSSPEDCTVILVGGGAILCPRELKGVSRIIRPDHAGVANAIGAALAKVHGSAEEVVDAENIQEEINRVIKAATQNAVAKGGTDNHVTILNETVRWVPYVEGKKHVHIEVACTADHTRVYETMIEAGNRSLVENSQDIRLGVAETKSPTRMVHTWEDNEETEILTYKPKVSSSGHWRISPTDLKFLEIGCYILGCGGGGSPHATYLSLLELLRQGEEITMVHPESLPDDAALPPVAGIGTPAVTLERLASDAVLHAMQRLGQELGVAATHMLAIEIGGMNGLSTLRWSAKRYCGVPVVDGDLMGRAYPSFEMISQYVHAETIDELFPVAICSGDGKDSVIPKGQSDVASAGLAIRKVCAAYGFAAGAAGNILSGRDFRRVGIPHTFSLAWRLGRVVRHAQISSTLEKIPDAIVSEVGGPQSARMLFVGKIRRVESEITETAHSLGQVIIQRLGEDETEKGWADSSGINWKEVKVPFMNENLAVVAVGDGNKEEALATTPDLIFLLDISTGEAIGIQEYRYGVKVAVMAMAPHPIWTSERGLEIVGPKVFKLPHEYSSSLVYHEPRSVIEEFS